MMVLTRRVGESICIGDDIKITVVENHRDGKVRLGITAPREVPVDRQEIHDAKQLDIAGSITRRSAC